MFWPAYLVAFTADRMLLAKVRLLQKHYFGWPFDGNFQGCHSYHRRAFANMLHYCYYRWSLVLGFFALAWGGGLLIDEIV